MFSNRKSRLRLVYDWFSIGFRLVCDWFSIGENVGEVRRSRNSDFLTMRRLWSVIASVAETYEFVEAAEIVHVNRAVVLAEPLGRWVPRVRWIGCTRWAHSRRREVGELDGIVEVAEIVDLVDVTEFAWAVLSFWRETHPSAPEYMSTYLTMNANICNAFELASTTISTLSSRSQIRIRGSVYYHNFS